MATILRQLHLAILSCLDLRRGDRGRNGGQRSGDSEARSRVGPDNES